MVLRSSGSTPAVPVKKQLDTVDAAASCVETGEQHLHLRSISLKALDARSPAELQKLLQVCQSDGFFYLVDHGVPQMVIEMVLNASQSFFMQPLSMKNSVHYKKTEFHPHLPGVCGYVSPADENVGPSAADLPERKEAFDWVIDRPAKGQPFRGPNVWPSINGFREALERYSKEVTRTSWHLLDAFAVAQGLHRSVYRDMCHDPLSWTRITHYPAAEHGQDNRTKGVNAHTDGSFFTVVLQDKAGGLQAKFRGEKWVHIPPIPGALVINIGDVLAAITGGIWRSTPHRVLSGQFERFSVAHFFVPDADALSFARLNETTAAAKVLLFKAGLGDANADLEVLRGMTFAEYRLKVYRQYLPDRIANKDFTDINQ